MLNKSVSKTLKLTGGSSTDETARLVEFMDKFFDTSEWPLTQSDLAFDTMQFLTVFIRWGGSEKKRTGLGLDVKGFVDNISFNVVQLDEPRLAAFPSRVAPST